MKKIFLLVLMCCWTLSLKAVKCAVLRFEGAESVSIADVDGIDRMFMTYFYPAGYTMVDRHDIDKLIAEQELQYSDLTTAQLVRMGKILNVSKIVVGTVSMLGREYQVDVLVLDVETSTYLPNERDGATFRGDYREEVKNIATRLAGKIAIRPTKPVQATPTKSTTQPNVLKPRQKVDVLYGYLKVFPKELGKFPSEPKTVIKRINQQAQHGYNNWRLPTEEEEALLRAENYLNDGQQYMTYESRNEEGIVLLVSDGEDYVTIKRAEKAREDSIAAAIEKARQDSIAEENRIAEAARIAAAKIKARQDSIAEAKRLTEEARIAAAKEKARNDSIAAIKEKARKDSIAEANRIAREARQLEIARQLKEAEQWEKESYQKALKEQGWVDLGLPSGTMWKNKNEKGYYSYNKAISKFKNSLPTMKQLSELIVKCKWTWNGSGYRVEGANGESIILPTYGIRACEDDFVDKVGSYGCYWSSTPYESSRVWHIVLSSSDVTIGYSQQCYGLSIRLAKDSTCNDYVDLGLPSGTLWKEKNERGYYTYDRAIENYGQNLPSDEQFKELKEKCTWKWINNLGYIVTGPNGNSIFLPAAGHRECGDGMVGMDGSIGEYWSSTPLNIEVARALNFHSSNVYMYNPMRCMGQSVRLVKNTRTSNRPTRFFDKNKKRK